MSKRIDNDRLPFYGSTVPRVIKLLKKGLTQIDRQTLQKIMRLAISTIEGKPVPHDTFNHLQTDVVTLEMVHLAYAGTLKVLQLAFRCSSASLTEAQFSADLSTIVPQEVLADFTAAVFGSRRSVLESRAIEDKPRFPTIAKFKWKIDVAISTTSLNRVLEPVVSAQLIFSNGEQKAFEMSLAKFQELRYHTASVLKEMEGLEKRSILKIQD